ncbi:hypothetical protein LINPERHAP1_LOCUS9214 [Linum perenne]
MRIRVRLDVRKSLKKEKWIKNAQKEALVTFKYERLPTFCFICGRIDHIDRYCEVRFRIPADRIVKLWDATLKAHLRRRRLEPTSKYLVTPAPVLSEQLATRGSSGSSRRPPLAEI